MKMQSRFFLVIALFVLLAAVLVWIRVQAVTTATDDPFMDERAAVRRAAWEQSFRSQLETISQLRLPMIIRGLEDEDPEVRKYAVYMAYRALATASVARQQIGVFSKDLLFRKELLEEAASASVGDVRGQALATAVIAFGLAPDVRDILITSYKTDGNVEVHRAIVHALAYASKREKLPPELLDILVHAMGSQSRVVRSEATRAILQLSEVPPQAKAQLGGVLDEINQATLLAKAANILGSMNPPPENALHPLVALLDTDDVFLLRSLIPAVAAYGEAANEYIPQLEDAIERMDEPVKSEYRKKYIPN